MSEMVERVARAIVKVCEHRNWDPEAMAIAAIEAMREPTPAMEDAGNSYESVHALGQWQVMIDAALKGNLE